jgi:hypothetical protein
VWLGEAATRATARAWPPRDVVGPPLRCNMERRGAASELYSQGAVPRKEGGDWGTDSITARKENDDGVDLRKGALLTHRATLSATTREEGKTRRARLRARPAALSGLGPKRETEGGRERAARGEKKGGRWAAGCGLSWAKS